MLEVPDPASGERLNWSEPAWAVSPRMLLYPSSYTQSRPTLIVQSKSLLSILEPQIIPSTG